MRSLFLLAASLLVLGLGACRQAEEPSPPPPAATTADGATLVFAGEGRDRLCLKEGEQRAGVITYAASGDNNCSVRGAAAGSGEIRPDGDSSCVIPLRREGDRITLGVAGPACAYYCGPGASLSGKTFARMDRADAVTDLAGEPLC
jgi:hypothetical protein